MNDEDLIDDSFATNNAELGITEQSKGFLLETAKWGKVLAILGFVFTGFIVLGTLVTLFFFSQRFNAERMAVMFIVYILITLLYLFPSLYLFKFSNKTKSAINSMNTTEMQEAFLNLKSLFKFMSISMIVILSIYTFNLILEII